jgi:hypothetical protein
MKDGAEPVAFYYESSKAGKPQFGFDRRGSGKS